MKWLQILVLSVIGIVSAGSALAAPQESAEAFVKRSFDVIQRDGLPSVVEFMHPDELDRMKTMMAPLFEKPPSGGKSPVSLGLFGTAYSPREFKELSSKGFVRSLLSKINGLGKASLVNAQVLGSVREGELVHVLTRSTASVEDIRMTQVQVVTLKPHGDSWGMMLTGELEGYGLLMKKMAQAMEENEPEEEGADEEGINDEDVDPEDGGESGE